MMKIQRKIIVVKYNGKEINFYVTLGICQIKLNFCIQYLLYLDLLVDIIFVNQFLFTSNFFYYCMENPSIIYVTSHLINFISTFLSLKQRGGRKKKVFLASF